MKTLILDHMHGGHHLTYVRKLASALVPYAESVVVSVGEGAVSTAEFQQQLGSLGETVDVCPELRIDSRGRLGMVRAIGRAVREAVDRHQPDILYFPTADTVAQSLAVLSWLGAVRLPRGLRVEGAIHRGTFAYPEGVRRTVPRPVSTALLERSPLNLVHFVDHSVYDFVVDRGGAFVQKCCLLPDPVEHAESLSKRESRHMLGIPTEGRYIGCSGLLDARKGTPLLIEAFASAPLGPEDRLLLCGRASESVRSLVSERYAALLDNKRIVLIDRYVSDEELRASLGAVDVVCTPHPAHIGLSNIALRALAAGRPVLGSDFGWIGKMVPRFNLGTTCDVRDAGSFSRAIVEALDSSVDYTRSEAATRLLAFHGEANFARSWVAGIREMKGIGPDPELLTFDWVLEGRNDLR